MLWHAASAADVHTWWLFVVRFICTVTDVVSCKIDDSEVWTNISADTEGPRNAASREIDDIALHRSPLEKYCTLSVITRQQALWAIFKAHCYTDRHLSVISTYRVSQKTGPLCLTDHIFKTPKPMCMIFGIAYLNIGLFWTHQLNLQCAQVL